jgi:nucleoid-associated protein YgaU
LAVGEGTKASLDEANAPSSEPKREAIAARNVNEAGWVSIPNSGMIPRDSSDDPVRGSDSTDPATGSAPAASTGDSRAHAARDIVFEPEPSQARNSQPPAADSAGGRGHATGGSTRESQPRAASHSERVEATDHLIERGDNYWTISRQYYNSGRYYRALWKANAARYPDIDVLHVGDVIVVPPVEDLDPDYILPVRTRAPSSSRTASLDRPGQGQGRRRDDERDTAVSESPSRPSGSITSGKVSLAARSSGSTARRADPADSDLDLPVSGDTARRDRVASYKGRSPAASGVFEGDGDESETRDSARPRGLGGNQPGRPVYRVRSYDTLRSIARDTLGDARRSDEILELNRGLIDNPNQLVVGQLLELPDDARTAIRRPASRR